MIVRLTHAQRLVTVEEYRAFRRDGFLVVRGLVSPDEIDELRAHTEDIMHGRLTEQQDGRVEAPPAGLSPLERALHLVRIHMLHRQLELHERYLLHPRVLDVLQALIGPDVLALQTMLFLKPPGREGQGWHQDSYYIPTEPDSLCGAWIAIDDCDEYNGAMWFARGSQIEPSYPSQSYGHGDRQLADIGWAEKTSDMDDAVNQLAPVADRYPQVLVPAKAGDVVFFGGHVLHRSKPNRSDRFRRAFVSHYCNARAYTSWGADGPADNPHSSPTVDPVTKATNGSHILARGDTHLAYATSKFGTPCAALAGAEERKRQREFCAADDAALGSRAKA